MQSSKSSLIALTAQVAAAHMNADSVVHFGHTCLTPSRFLSHFFTQYHTFVTRSRFLSHFFTLITPLSHHQGCFCHTFHPGSTPHCHNSLSKLLQQSLDIFVLVAGVFLCCTFTHNLVFACPPLPLPCLPCLTSSLFGMYRYQHGRSALFTPLELLEFNIFFDPEGLNDAPLQYDHLLGPWKSSPSVIKAQCNQEAEGIIWLGRKVRIGQAKKINQGKGKTQTENHRSM